MEGKTFLKGKVESREEKVQAKNQPIHDKKRGVVFVNGGKYRRAEDILALLRGVKAVSKAQDAERKEHYAKQLAIHEIDVNSDDALPAIYEVCGGLIRTLREQTQEEKRLAEMKKQGKKRMIQ